MLRSGTPLDHSAIAEIFLESRHTAMPWLNSPVSDDDVRGWFQTGYGEKNATVVAELDGEVVAFAGWSDGWLNHLYVHPSHWRKGLGKLLIEHVETTQPQGFTLWVFQRNANARSFYEHLGATKVRETDGQTNMEKEPDCLYEWRPT